jgi:hypothetical protein
LASEEYGVTKLLALALVLPITARAECPHVDVEITHAAADYTAEIIKCRRDVACIRRKVQDAMADGGMIVMEADQCFAKEHHRQP